MVSRRAGNEFSGNRSLTVAARFDALPSRDRKGAVAERVVMVAPKDSNSRVSP